MELWGLHPMYILVFMDMIFLFIPVWVNMVMQVTVSSCSHMSLIIWHLWVFLSVSASGYSCLLCTSHLLCSPLSPHCMAFTPMTSTLFFETSGLFCLQGFSPCLWHSLYYLLIEFFSMTQIQIWNENKCKLAIKKLFHLSQ